MRIIGIDPSSTICGASVIEAPDAIVKVMHWEADKSRSAPQRFLDYHNWLGAVLHCWKPHMAVIEMLSVERNAVTAKVVSHYQAISALTCKMHGLWVVEARVSTGRKVVLGRGNMSKDEAWEIMRKRYPNLFAPKTRGGLDEMDALVMALAGETAAER